MRFRRRRAERRARAEALAQMVKLCEEDTILLGEQLRRLDTEAAERPLDEAARVSYQAALDAYETAQRQLTGATGADEVEAVVETLNDGRYALACVQASLAGEPRPERRKPCYFNPQHGPSVTDVMFTARAAGTKNVPACAQDAARVKAGERPAVRRFEVNGRKLDYFDLRAIGRSHGNPAAMNALLGSTGFGGDVSGYGGWGGDVGGFDAGGGGDS